MVVGMLTMMLVFFKNIFLKKKKKEFNHRNKKNLLSKDLDQFLKNISTKLEPFYAPR